MGRRKLSHEELLRAIQDKVGGDIREIPRIGMVALIVRDPRGRVAVTPAARKRLGFRIWPLYLRADGSRPRKRFGATIGDTVDILCDSMGVRRVPREELEAGGADDVAEQAREARGERGPGGSWR